MRGTPYLTDLQVHRYVMDLITTPTRPRRLLVRYSDDGGTTWSDELWIPHSTEGLMRWRGFKRTHPPVDGRYWQVSVVESI